MELRSTIVTINDLLRFDFDLDFLSNASPSLLRFNIPAYQREFTWDKVKVKTFVDNIMQQSKFLGFITIEITNETNLSILDGQQRITTIFLMLAQLFNVCGEEGEIKTQQEIRDLLFYTKEDKDYLKLENESVGEFLHYRSDPITKKTSIELKIELEKDIYKQKDNFDLANDEILLALQNRNESDSLEKYKQKLLDCNVLLFAQKNSTHKQQGSSEEIYLDINEKAQRLMPEDIIKGHCFALCKTIREQNEVKEYWKSIKQCFFKMDKLLGKSNMDAFLHFYFLTQEKTKNNPKDISNELTINGSNIIVLDYGTPTKVISLLKNMNTYQLNLLQFENDLKGEICNFDNIMTDSAQNIGNYKNGLKEAKIMFKQIVYCNQNMFKLPLFYMIDVNMRKQPDNRLSCVNMLDFVHLYYVYMFLFSRKGSSKKREKLPTTLFKKINEAQGQEQIKELLNEIKTYADGFRLSNKELSKEDVRKQLYAIVDYLQNKNERIDLRLLPADYNKEHLVINQSNTVNWQSKDETSTYEFVDTDFAEYKSSIKNNIANWTNFIWIEADFNREKLANKDIVNKILQLRGSLEKESSPKKLTCAKKNKHVELICQHIMETEGFSDLINDYEVNAAKDIVLEHYCRFINNYFDEENIAKLCTVFENEISRVINELG